MKRLNILITNDDGIFAPGIKHLWNALKESANLFIVAPAMNQSSVGLSITMRKPLYVKKIDWKEETPAWSVSGTPADCVQIGLSTLISSSIDLIVSGINQGGNAGRNVLYSGTVGGAIEGALKGTPAIAFSCQNYEYPRYDVYEKFIPKIVKHVVSHPLPDGSLLNVNFPEYSSEGVKGFKMCRQGQSFWGQAFGPSFEEKHVKCYTPRPRIFDYNEVADSDVEWLNKGYITAAPIYVQDLTDFHHLKQEKENFEKSLETDLLEMNSQIQYTLV